MQPRRTLPVLALAALLAAPAFAQLKPPTDPPQPPAKPGEKVEEKVEPLKPLDLALTEAVVRSYASAEHWALQAIVLLSLGNDFHPAGAVSLASALRAEDERLRPYATEVLRGMEDAKLALVATPELVDALIEVVSKEKNELFASRTAEVLTRLFADGPGLERKSWKRFWQERRERYSIAAWQSPSAEASDGRSTAGTFVERAFDLRDAGLDVAIVIDSTGSMQAAIDTARDAIYDVVSLLSGVAPKLRLGVVHYKDVSDFSDGARLLTPLTKKQDVVRESLAKLVANGGGDVPESVDKGLEAALGKEMDWNRDANRLILLIGDAPPHPPSMGALLQLVKDAHDKPFARGGKPLSGRREPLKPFITSTIATSQACKAEFEQIAKAGGGASVYMEVRNGAGRATNDVDPAKAARSVVEHVLLLSFGAQHRPQLRRFTSVYFEYRDAGLFE
ncbi:MAG: VWA domain-containing protein [Planctomycetes bacterium]|nr:VWA domain-containing protein [Planctomycetota bacterium]